MSFDLEQMWLVNCLGGFTAGIAEAFSSTQGGEPEVVLLYDSCPPRAYPKVTEYAGEHGIPIVDESGNEIDLASKGGSGVKEQMWVVEFDSVFEKFVVAKVPHDYPFYSLATFALQDDAVSCAAELNASNTPEFTSPCDLVDGNCAECPGKLDCRRPSRSVSLYDQGDLRYDEMVMIRSEPQQGHASGSSLLPCEDVGGDCAKCRGEDHCPIAHLD